MLKLKETNVRTYEERMADAISAIPLITDDWTNFNASDPGITILENLVLFSALQGSKVSQMNDEAKRALLKMVGFEAEKGKCARLLLSADELPEKIHLKNNQRFLLGDMSFETRKVQDVGDCHVTGICSYYDEKYHNCNHLINREFVVPTKIFGESPSVDDAIYFMCDSLPEPGAETSFYIHVDTSFRRNPLKDRSNNIFASFIWECYTKKGFEEMKVKDFTGALLMSGEVKLKFPRNVKYEKYKIDEIDGMEGYCIRAKLTNAAYDVRPRIMQVNAFLFEVWQKDTKSLVQTFQRAERLRFVSPYENGGYILCFGREGKGEPYRRYELSLNTDKYGRYCLYEKTENGGIVLSFSKQIFGYEPSRTKDAVRVVVYNEEVMRQYHVGRVLGYDDQEIELPFRHIVPESFLLLAKRINKDGEEIFDFLRPGKNEDEALSYYLLETDGRIVIEDPGDFIGAELYIASVTVTDGPKGNIRAGNYLVSPEFSDKPLFYNPGPGTGGAFREKLDDVVERFRKDVYTSYTCVTAADYEKAVSSVPGLCIRKVRAVMDELDNLVHVAVLPGTDEQFPRLSKLYIETITNTLSEWRMITTRFQILSPIYVGVQVRMTVYVKRQFSDCKEQIEEKCRSLINYIDSDKNFGEPLIFEDIFAGIESLDCVDYVYELFIQPDNLKHAVVRDSNIYPAENCLLYPGQILLETITSNTLVR